MGAMTGRVTGRGISGIVGVVACVSLAACSGSGGSTSNTAATAVTTDPTATDVTTTVTPTTVPTTVTPTTAVPTTVPTAGTGPERPEGPAADVSETITGSTPPFMGSAIGTDVPAGYIEEEFVAAGVAVDHRPIGPLSDDGVWTLEPDTEAPYRTRVLVRRPADPSVASGTVLVEWLNVSGGLDANPDYAATQAEIVRAGHTWIGVSAQQIGVDGGPVLVSAPGAESIVGRGLRALDPQRYGSLDHPGDGYSFDIVTQVARAARAGGPLTAGAVPDVVLAIGQSQSAIALVSYINGVQPLTQAFDGFLVHSRASASLPFVAPGESADLGGSIGAGVAPRIRADLGVPVLTLQAENDVVGLLNSVAVRQPDTERLRLWEVAGTAHADRTLLGAIADGLSCGAAINDGPMHVVAKSALRALDTWVRDGTPPPTAPLLEVVDGAFVRDTDGIVAGGIRTPPVDVPVDVLSGEPGPNPDLLCVLLGSTTPLSPERLAELYPSVDDYTARYSAAADAAVEAGFVLAADRASLLAFAAPDRIAG
jgi:hypothetical protein